MNKRIEALVSRAISTADLFVNGQPEDAQVFFDVDALQRLTRAIRTPEAMLVAMAAAWEQMILAITEHKDIQSARIALELHDRLQRGTGHRYVEGPDGLKRVD